MGVVLNLNAKSEARREITADGMALKAMSATQPRLTYRGRRYSGRRYSMKYVDREAELLKQSFTKPSSVTASSLISGGKPLSWDCRLSKLQQLKREGSWRSVLSPKLGGLKTFMTPKQKRISEVSGEIVARHILRFDSP